MERPLPKERGLPDRKGLPKWEERKKPPFWERHELSSDYKWHLPNYGGKKQAPPMKTCEAAAPLHKGGNAIPPKGRCVLPFLGCR